VTSKMSPKNAMVFAVLARAVPSPVIVRSMIVDCTAAIKDI